MDRLITVKRAEHEEVPAHHVISEDSKARTFQNPWDSWHKPTIAELVQGLEWGERDGNRMFPSILGSLKDMFIAPMEGKLPRPSYLSRVNVPLHVQKPDFSFAEERVKATWLGHAGSLVQLPPLTPGDRPFTVLFDPIFSARCSPSQWIGPIRSFRPPCKVKELPPIDLVVISHNHFDHLDFHTIESLWKHFPDTVHFFAPLGNKDWFIQPHLGISAERVYDMDWWDEAHIHAPSTGTEVGAGIRLVCTPAQHCSGRSIGDACRTLWASWFLEHTLPDNDVFRIYFGGDTGYQFHTTAGSDDDTYPACPAFEQITDKLGAPDLSLLPVSVGATYAYLKSFDILPDGLSPVPRMNDGLTGANHMSASDAVKVFTIMQRSSSKRVPVAMGIHWGTFVEGMGEVVDTMTTLEKACQAHQVDYARALHTKPLHPTFALVHHGQSISLPR
ncbi:N-acylphosphatidylethanolamine-specific phospholipase D [Malassezia pachydermatis]|uniref:Metallo-beta-lactamase domain-containing protein n=1 Tax=Malassezia pachydermatis TaxID=77020 RepID=A0A0M9VPF3_9BASI|nr:hypothetical protein Malapachy_3913 [Malassezia pachydermatis]KOS14373.1 hypothetical protein Malapachy_3913 [Malassezia pachydermatis]